MRHAQLYKPHPWPHQFITTEVIAFFLQLCSLVLFKSAISMFACVANDHDDRCILYRLMRVLRTLDHGPKFRYHPGKRLKEYTLQDLMFVKTLPPVLTLPYLDCHSPSRQILHLIPVIHQTFLTPTFNKGANS